MGGLVVRGALETGAPSECCVSDLFLIGTPQAGSRMAELQPVGWMAQQMVYPKQWKEFIEEGLGEASVDLMPGSPFLIALDKGQRPKNVRYHVVAGTRGFVDDKGAANVSRTIKSWLPAKFAETKSGQTFDRLGSMDEIVHGRGDGCVTITSARGKNSTSYQTFELDHLGLTHGKECDPVWRHILRSMSWSKE
jgi:hypothetical protein